MTDDHPDERHRLDGPPPRVQPTTSLVVGWNGQPPSIAAVLFAITLAQQLTAHLHIVHIVDFDDLPIDPDGNDFEDDLAATVDASARRARRLLDPVLTGWTYHAAHGSPADLLDAVAEENDALMVIVGSPRGGILSFLQRLDGSSVSHRLIGEHRRPLLLVPEVRH